MKNPGGTVINILKRAGMIDMDTREKIKEFS